MIERIIEYVLPREDDAAALQVLRLTISEMNTLQHARWLRLRRETMQWSQDVLGIAFDAKADEIPADLAERQEQAWRRAAMLGTLKRVELGVLAGDAEEVAEWQESELPQEWQGIDAFIDEVPWQLFDVWLALSLECNPGAFMPEPDAGEKKRLAGQVSVHSSTKRLTIS